VSDSEDGLEALFDLDEVVLPVVVVEFDGVVMEVGKGTSLDVQDVDHLPHVHVVDPGLLHLVVLPPSLVSSLQLGQDLLEVVQKLRAHLRLSVAHLYYYYLATTPLYLNT
jgi:hypothetical protein